MTALLGAAALSALLAQTPTSPPPPAPVVAPTVANPFTNLLPNLGEDVRAMPTLENAGILAKALDGSKEDDEDED